MTAQAIRQTDKDRTRKLKEDEKKARIYELSRVQNQVTFSYLRWKKSHPSENHVLMLQKYSKLINIWRTLE